MARLRSALYVFSSDIRKLDLNSKEKNEISFVWLEKTGEREEREMICWWNQNWGRETLRYATIQYNTMYAIQYNSIHNPEILFLHNWVFRGLPSHSAHWVCIYNKTIFQIYFMFFRFFMKWKNKILWNHQYLELEYFIFRMPSIIRGQAERF